ncbi:MAG: tetratricopeptide repeat protein [Rhodocyclaceae bacterium]|nr:tetratricopeptide repeat protein [Rhodocyclaceae bacterium]
MAFQITGPDKESAERFAKAVFLVVDDFQGMRSMLRDILRNCGANASAIDMAANGSEAVTMLGKRRYDVVLCDFDLGPGKNGQQVLEEAKHRQLVGPGSCWVMVTAEKSTETVMGAGEYQPDAYLVKPITETMLSGRLARLWQKKGSFAAIDKAMAAHDYLKAIRLCDERLTTDRANAADLLRLKCDLLLKVGDPDAARKVYESILAQRDVPWAQVGLARLHFQGGDLEAARDLLEQVVDINRSYLEAYDWLARTQLALGDTEGAQAVLGRAVALSPNSVTRQKNLGEIDLKLGNLDGAERAFRKSVALGKHSILKTADAYLGLAKAYGGKANPVEAMKVLAEVGKEFDTPEVQLKAKLTEGLVHRQAGNEAAAREAARSVAELLDQSAAQLDSTTSIEMAQFMLTSGETEKALAVLDAEVRNNPENGQLLAEVDKVLEGTDLAEQGRAMIEATRLESIEMMNRGVLLAREERYEDAVSAMRAARDKMPANVRVLLNFSYVLLVALQKTGYDRDRIREARECLLRANTLSPGEKRFAQLMSLLENLEREAASRQD